MTENLQNKINNLIEKFNFKGEKFYKLIILFAYRYLKNIKKTHGSFIKKNGIFLSPLPEFKLHQ